MSGEKFTTRMGSTRVDSLSFAIATTDVALGHQNEWSYAGQRDTMLSADSMQHHQYGNDAD